MLRKNDNISALLRISLLAGSLLCSSLAAKAQLTMPDRIRQQLRTGIADTTRVQLMLQLGNYYLRKPGEDPPDLDSALLLARQAAGLSQRIDDAADHERAILLSGIIHAEAKHFDRAEALLPSLGDTSRMRLMLEMADYHLYTAGTGRGSWDSSLALSAKVITLSQRLNTPIYEALGWRTSSLYYYTLGDGREGKSRLLRSWTTALRSKDLATQYEVFYRPIAYFVKDSSLHAATMETFHHFMQDDLTLLHPTDRPEWLNYCIFRWCFVCQTFYLNGSPTLARQAMVELIRMADKVQPYNPTPWIVLGQMEFEQGETDQCLQDYLEAVRRAESGPGLPADAMAYSGVARVYETMDLLQKSLDYTARAAAIYFRSPDSEQPGGWFYLRFTSLYLRLGRPLEALAMLDTARKKLLARSPTDFQLLNHSFGDCYFTLHEYEKAEKAYLEALRFTAGRSKDEAYSIYEPLARLCIAMGRFTKARPYLDTLIADSNRTLVFVNARRDAFYLSYRVDSATGDFHRATAHLLQYQRLADSIFNIEKNKQLTEITAKYETEKKDRNISSLNSAALLREADLRHARLLRNTLFAGSFLLILLLALLYNRYRLRKKTNQLLEILNNHQHQLLSQKDLLMREAHHRVKNSLQLVMSLLEMQASTLRDERALTAFDDTQARIHAISLIHQKLYRENQNISVINMRDYIGEMVGFLEAGFSRDFSIHFQLDIHPIEVDVDQGLSLGLIVNEAVTNTLKYAFPPAACVRSPKAPDSPGKPNGVLPTVTITLHEQSSGLAQLSIADNGIGLPAGFDPGISTSMGLQLIHTLSLQLKGTLVMENSPGLRITLRFPLKIGDYAVLKFRQ